MVSKLTERAGPAEAGIEVSEDNDCNEQRAATSREGIMRPLTGYEEIVKEKGPSSRQSSVLDFFSSPGSRALPSVLSNSGNDDPRLQFNCLKTKRF
jgi:hypothetical protein